MSTESGGLPRIFNRRGLIPASHLFPNPFHRAIYLTGPTASGKTAVGVELARKIGAEVVALDSMTLYRGMTIGTAKPSVEERGGIPHHLLDVLDPWEAASVADYRAWAGDVLQAIESRGRIPLFVGGTALYLKALLRGLFAGPAADEDLRRTLESEAEAIGGSAMHERLAAIDPATASRLHPNDRRRVIRALEVAALTGRPLSSFQTEHERIAPLGVRVLALERPRDELCRRIDERVARMFEEGLVEEVRSLVDAPRPLHRVPAQGVGYREVADFLAGRVSLAEALALTRARTRQFAKRQGTWFRGLAEVKLWPVEAEEPAGLTAARIASRLELWPI